MTEEELRQLQELAEAAGLSASDYVRQFVRRTHEATLGALTVASDLFERSNGSISAEDVAKVLSTRTGRTVSTLEVEAVLDKSGWIRLRSERYRPPVKRGS